MVPRSGSGDLVRGRLVITPEALELYRRAEGSEKGSCVLAWRLETSQVRSLGFGKVLSRYSGLIFYLDDGDVRFVSFSAKKRKQDILKELGWSQITETDGCDGGGPAAMLHRSKIFLRKITTLFGNGNRCVSW
jgi:hypothetical protein